MRYKNTFREKLLEYINTLPDNVILRKDIELSASSRQISRALNDLIKDKKLVRIGWGVYAKARTSDYFDFAIISCGFTQACVEALERFNVKWEATQAVKDYNDGRSQQVPARFEIRLKSRFRRKLAYEKQKLRIEGMIYAK